MSKLDRAILGFGNDPFNKMWLKGFPLTRYINIFLDAFSNELVVRYRKIDVCPDLVALF